jgi:hypothetical protein
MDKQRFVCAYQTMQEGENERSGSKLESKVNISE